ncbi:MAG TPA: glycoside hydrolase family 43 protein [Chitinophagaceae bacterium]|nr:glycoside hydrolase family 43 protein [Chitinophagaceae bacterium]
MMNLKILLACCLTFCFLASSAQKQHNNTLSSTVQKEETFTNPLLSSGADPWAIYHNGFYYYMQTMGNRLVIWKTKDLAKLKSAERKTIWTPPKNTAYSKEIWAPELHFIDGKWYVYFAADDGNNNHHRMYVLENESRNPLKGNWVFKGKIAAATDRWAIDGSVFEYNDQWYMIWSGWEKDVNGQQNIYIAKMKNPWTIDGDRVRISFPKYAWEKHGDLPNQSPAHVNVNEGPEILMHHGEVFLIYSASGCWTDYYCLGMLSLENKKNLMTASSWRKHPKPVFKGSKKNSVYAPGHNSFFQSPNGEEYWILYHANGKANQGCGGHRSPRKQSFEWNPDGTPDFGVPVKTGQPLSLPSVK